VQASDRHVDIGGEISRDEVPLLYQSHVQQYFEAVRKQKMPAVSMVPETKPRLTR
jgi:hypothetical protein